MKFNMAVLRAYVRQYCTRMHAYGIQQAKHTPESDEIAKEEIIKAYMHFSKFRQTSYGRDYEELKYSGL
jgi:hypothetical protein